MKVEARIATELNLSESKVGKVLELFDGGATIPFVARYRKELTGALDEISLEEIASLQKKFEELDKRKESILDSIKEQGKLDSVLEQKILSCNKSSELEDLYLPYKQKRKTKASIAHERGLEPLAKIIMAQREHDVHGRARKYLNREIKDTDAAIEGASHIIAEWISERAYVRNSVRQQFEKYAELSSKLVKGKESLGEKYKNYFSFSEWLNRSPSHRLLAIRRAEAEGILRVSIAPDKDKMLERLDRLLVKSNNESGDIVRLAVKDSYQRLMKPSIENEFAKASKEKADIEAIKVFVNNLRQLLLAPPLGPKRILALDPGYKSGCKLVCLDANGGLLHNENIYPHAPRNDWNRAQSKISQLINAYKIEAVAIGNGTAGRETEQLVKSIKYDGDVQVFVVNEDGASVYSASKVARDEFPEYDVTVRGAVSIGRRLIDPLAELVKIDAKSIGVGQYQHDVDQTKLKESLDRTVESCVNQVGVNLNTASVQLLSYVSGLGPVLAQNIVDYRSEKGSFKTRAELKKVKRLGDKAFEQCAGFLRIKDGKNPLDNSAVHPESYTLVNKIAKSLKVDVAALLNNKELLTSVDASDHVTNKAGEHTIKDILQELAKPGLDPRKKVRVFEFSKHIETIKDLRSGMTLPGIVSNLTNFGAFVDLGIKENGLIHISQITERFISSPAEALTLHQHVQVKVLDVDQEKKRIALTMKF